MITFLTNEKIDRKKWDDCINDCPEGNIFVSTFYLDAVCENWCALVLNDYEAVFPLASGKKYGVSFLYQPFFSRYFGTYCKNGFSEKINSDFFALIPEKYKYIEFCLHDASKNVPVNFHKQDRRYQLLDLKIGHADLSAKYSDNSKRNIKKAKRSGCIISYGIKAKDIVTLFRKTKGQELEIFGPKEYQKLLKLMETCESMGISESVAIHDPEGELCAAGFFMRFKNRYVFLKSGVTGNGKSNGCMHLLFDDFIAKHAGSQMVLDFGGSSVDSVARFYKNFGAKDCVYLQVKSNRLPKLVNWIKSLKK